MSISLSTGSTVPEGAGFVKMAAPVSMVCLLSWLAMVNISFPLSSLRGIIGRRKGGDESSFRDLPGTVG